MKKQQKIHIHMAPKLEEKIKQQSEIILELQNKLWRYKRNEQRYKIALHQILGVQMDIK